MKYDDLQFTITDNNGKEIECDIVSLIPKEDNEAYVIFIDGTKDENDNVVLKYGKLIKDEDEYELTAGINQEELEYIQNCFHDDLIELSKSIMEENGE